MFIPMATPSVPYGPGPEALALRKWLIGSVGALTLISILQLFLPLGASQVSSGVFGLLGVVAGVYCVRNGTVDMSAIMMLGMLCLSLGLNSLVSTLQVVINGGGIGNVYWLHPTALLVDTSIIVLCWKIFNADAVPYQAPRRSFQAATTYGATGGNFVPFSGGSQRIGAH